jgi:hypothetical protein
MSALPIVGIERIVRARVESQPALPYRIHTSAHSLDIIPSNSSKVNIIAALGARPEEVIAIGDSGDLGGNDFELLSRVTIGLSVDRISADPDRCWNIAAPGLSGPQALLGYLGAVRVVDGLARFDSDLIA